MALMIFGGAATASAAQKNIQQILETPLITGASVSANYLSASPGQVAALRYTEAKNLKVIAKGGKTSLDTVAKLSEKDFENRTAIIAVDAFFWDAVRPSADRSLEVLKNLVAQAKRRNIPLVLGDIPALMPAYQPSAAKLNRAIHEACKTDANCYVLPFDHMAKDLLFGGSIQIDGKAYTLFDLLPDGLHINKLASVYVANLIETLLLGGQIPH